MKKCLLFLFVALGLSSFTLMPIDDSSIVIPPGEASYLNYFSIAPSDSLSSNRVPYAFYVRQNLPINETIDTIFNPCYDDTITINITSPSKCYVYLMDAFNYTNGCVKYYVKNYNSALKRYSAKITVSGDDTFGYCRLIVTKDGGTIKNLTASIMEPSDPPIIHAGGAVSTQSESVIATTSGNCIVDVTTSDTTWPGMHIEKPIGVNIWSLSYDLNNASDEYASNTYDRQSLFTRNSSTDVEMFVLDSNKNIVGYVTDYTGNGNVDWGTDVRYDLGMNSKVAGVLLLPQIDYNDFMYYDSSSPIVNAPAGTTDLYVGCKKPVLPDNSFATLFPNLNTDDIIVSDPYRPYATKSNGEYVRYNSFAWATGGWMSNQLYFTFGIYTFFSDYGYTTAGATEENSIIDLYMHNGKYTHAAVRSYSYGAKGNSYGYDWESKLGTDGMRIMHPRYALVNDDAEDWYAYGHVVSHFIKDPNFTLDQLPVIENVEFTADEYAAISSLSGSATPEEAAAFKEKMAMIEDTVRVHCVNNLSLLKDNVDVYQEVLQAALQSDAVLGLILERVAEGDALAEMLVLDLSSETGQDVLENVTAYKAKKAAAFGDKKVLRSTNAMATLCAKELLGRADLQTSTQLFPEESFSYSSDADAFSVSVNGDVAHVSFRLPRAATVMVAVEDVEGMRPVAMSNPQRLAEGEHQLSVPVGSKGIYGVTLRINGRVYSKKINVR